MFLHVALAAAAIAPAPSVGRMTFSDLVRFSDVIVVATVASESVEPVSQSFELEHGRPGGTAKLGTLHVERWIKGSPNADALVFLNQSTWTCDITGAKVGERALFFLCEPKDHALQSAIPTYSQLFSEQPLLLVVHSGRGQMNLRNVAGEELATCWTGDVRLTGDAPRRPGPQPEYSFIESIPLDWLLREIPAIAASQHVPQVRLEADAGTYPGLPWQLTVRLDRTAALVVGPPDGAVSRELVLGWSAARAIDMALDQAKQFQAFHELGVPRLGAWDRRLVVMTSDGEHVVRLGVLADDVADAAARQAAELWTAVRSVIDDPDAIDHRQADAKLLE